MSLIYRKVSLQGLWKLDRPKYKNWFCKQLKSGMMVKKLEIHPKNVYLKPKAGNAVNISSDIIKI